MNAIMSGKVGETYKEPELQIGPTPLDSTMAAEESKEDAGAEEETALFRNIKLREAPEKFTLLLAGRSWHPYPSVEETVCGMTLEEVKAIRIKLSTASESQKEHWRWHHVDPLVLYFRELAARSSPPRLGAARPNAVYRIKFIPMEYHTY
jgi:hypothetical protein